MQMETVLHLRLFVIHEKGGMEAATLVEYLTADKKVGTCDIVNLHPMLRVFDSWLVVQT